VVRRQTTTRIRNGSILYRADNNLPPEVEELRHRDIEPDFNSALDKALNMAKVMAAESTHNGGSSSAAAGHLRRGSVRVTEPASPVTREKAKVEGREIQQGHEQYALTYGMMLGIRVSVCGVFKPVLHLFLHIFPSLFPYRLDDEILIWMYLQLAKVYLLQPVE